MIDHDYDAHSNAIDKATWRSIKPQRTKVIWLNLSTGTNKPVMGRWYDTEQQADDCVGNTE